MARGSFTELDCSLISPVSPSPGTEEGNPDEPFFFAWLSTEYYALNTQEVLRRKQGDKIIKRYVFVLSRGQPSCVL